MTEIDSISIDTTEAEESLKQLEAHADITAKTIMTTTQKGYNSLVLLADIFGQAIPLWFNLLAQAAFMAGTVFTELAAAETLSGWLAAKAVITFGIATMMFYRAMQLQTTKTEVENKLNSVLQLANIW